MSFRWMFFAIALLIVVASTMFLMMGDDENTAITIIAQERELDIDVQVVGELAAMQSHTITCMVDSIVTKLVPEGSLVKKDDIVIEFDDTNIRHELRQAELQLEAKQAEKQQAIAELEAERQKMLLDIETHRTSAEVARLQLRELNREPTPNNLKIAQLEYQSARAVMDIARKEYSRLIHQGRERVVRDEIQKLEIDLQQAVADYRKAELNLRLVSGGAFFLEIEQYEAERDKALLQLSEVENAMPDKVKQLESKIEQASTQIEAAQNNVKKAQDQLLKAKGKAPSDGLIVYRQVWGKKLMEGSNYWNGAALMDIPDLSTMVLKGKVLESYIGLLKIGQSATVIVDGIPNTTFSGKVTKIGKIAIDTSEKEVVGFLDKKGDTGIKVFEVFIQLEEDSNAPQLLPRMVARARISINKAKGVTIPRLAIHKREGKSFVFVSTKGKVKPVEVTLAQGNDHEVIVQGLPAQSTLLLHPSGEKKSNEQMDSLWDSISNGGNDTTRRSGKNSL